MRTKPKSPGVAVAAAALLLLVALPFPGAGAAEASTTLAVLGETHGTRTITRDIVNQAAAKGATGCICPGDFIFGDSAASPSGYRSMMQPFMGRMIPAQGNHDWPWSDWSSMFPNGQAYYSTDVDGVHVIVLNPEQHSLSAGSTQRAWLERELDSRDPSALKVVALHRPWWLPTGARHPESEFSGKAGTSGATMDGLMRAHGVDLVVAGHEKNYQHSLRDGVHYLIQGSTGPEWDKYPMGYTLPGAIKRLSTDVGSVLRISAGSMTLESFDRSGGFVESFTMTGSGWTGGGSTSGGATDGATGGSVSFSSNSGNEWWAQVKTSGATVTKVEAKDENSAWTPLAWRSWGAWAGSLHIEPGHTVTYRATLADGTTATSCAYAHPSNACATAAPAPTQAPAPAPAPATTSLTFSSNSGNEWWAQVKTSGATVTKVEAKDEDTAWTPLAWRSWGAWAASLHIEPGHTVTYRATLADGTVATSCAYAHPTNSCASAAPASAPAPTSSPSPSPTSSPSVAFVKVRGNAWWVETETTGATPVTVEARVDGGAWTALARTSWGSWARSLAAPTGSGVEFRATTAEGATAVSARYAWPQA